MHSFTRRGLLSRAGGLAVGVTFGSTLLDRALVGGIPNITGDGRYGPLGTADVNNVRLPTGFSSRVIARAGSSIGETGFPWRSNVDGGACFAHPSGGWVYAVNHENSGHTGGVSAIRFDAVGDIVDAYSILSGTERNCSGGPTPWDTYLSCEETTLGQVYECNPFAASEGVVRPLLGAFNHEAAAIDPVSGDVYLTEDRPTGRLYRFVPTSPGQLTSGQLFAAIVDLTNIETQTSPVTWQPVPSSAPDRSAGTTGFDGGEGTWVDHDRLLFVTKGDSRVWELEMRTQMLRLLHDCRAHPELALNDVDGVTVHEQSGDIYITEDAGNMELGLIEERAGGDVAVSAFLQIVGHVGSEVTGVAFNPNGDRLYISSQRGANNAGIGVTYEISGPFARRSSLQTPVQYAGLRPAVRIAT